MRLTHTVGSFVLAWSLVTSGGTLAYAQSAEGLGASLLPVDPPDPTENPAPTTDGVPGPSLATWVSPADFVGVFARVPAPPEPASPDDFKTLLTSVVQAATPEAIAAALPESVRRLDVWSELAPGSKAIEAPDVEALFASGTVPPVDVLLPPDMATDVPSFARTGETPPGCPFEGEKLHPTLAQAGLRPYGIYPTNPTNDWCMPNSPTGGCDVVGNVWGFNRACRQHDLAYRWKPVSDLGRIPFVEGRLYRALLQVCASRRWWQFVPCYATANLVIPFTIAFGGFAYGRGTTAGYSEPGGPEGWRQSPVTPPFDRCPTPALYAQLYTGNYSTMILRGKPLYFTGVVRKYSKVRFQIRDLAGNLHLEHVTKPARDNCVVHHEPEAVSSNVLSPGEYQAFARFTTENATPVNTEQDVDVPLQRFSVFVPSGQTTCQAESGTYVFPANRGAVVQNAVVYPTGVVRRHTRATFHVLNPAGQAVWTHTTQPARSNCVIHHEPEARVLNLPPGEYTLRTSYLAWENDAWVTRDGTLTVIAAGTGGGGGGGSGDCLRRRCDVTEIVPLEQ